VSAHDPLTFIAVPLVPGVVAMLATLIPARRAARVDPVIALRME
jgi:putative ABC transport system permease protein